MFSMLRIWDISVQETKMECTLRNLKGAHTLLNTIKTCYGVREFLWTIVWNILCHILLLFADWTFFFRLFMILLIRKLFHCTSDNVSLSKNTKGKSKLSLITYYSLHFLRTIYDQAVSKNSYSLLNTKFEWHAYFKVVFLIIFYIMCEVILNNSGLYCFIYLNNPYECFL